HRQRIHQRLIGRSFDSLPVGLEVVGFEKIRECGKQCGTIDRVLTLACDKIVGEWRISDAALPVWRSHLELLLEAESRGTGELNQITAVAGFCELGYAADAADLVQ